MLDRPGGYDRDCCDPGHLRQALPSIESPKSVHLATRRPTRAAVREPLCTAQRQPLTSYPSFIIPLNSRKRYGSGMIGG